VALGVDAHFCVEQLGRQAGGLFITFNGTAGVWRRDCLDQIGGWAGNAQAEDLDVSYRAQLAGWRIVYLPDVMVPGELPVEIHALKLQQARWAQGTIGTARTLLGPLWRSTQPLHVKLAGSAQLLEYAFHPLILILAVLTPVLTYFHRPVLDYGAWFFVTGLGPPLLHVVTQLTQRDRRISRLWLIPLLLLVGVGTSLSNSLAVFRLLVGRRLEFRRTPKYAIGRAKDWASKQYSLGADTLISVELGLAVFFLAFVALRWVNLAAFPALILYSAGFGFVGIMGVEQSYRRWRATRSVPTARKRVLVESASDPSSTSSDPPAPSPVH
jgi:cellulose synthase/poly-beta-1,6-N-acetylglucosamine synthase-like glycosyltransferase